MVNLAQTLWTGKMEVRNDFGGWLKGGRGGRGREVEVKYFKEGPKDHSSSSRGRNNNSRGGRNASTQAIRRPGDQVQIPRLAPDRAEIVPLVLPE